MAAAFNVGDKVNYPASANGSHQAGKGKVTAVHPYNDGTGHVYLVKEDSMIGKTLLVVFKETELTART